MEEPTISVSTQKMTVEWASAFSGTVTVSVEQPAVDLHLIITT